MNIVFQLPKPIYLSQFEFGQPVAMQSRAPRIGYDCCSGKIRRFLCSRQTYVVMCKVSLVEFRELEFVRTLKSTLAIQSCLTEYYSLLCR